MFLNKMSASIFGRNLTKGRYTMTATSSAFADAYSPGTRTSGLGFNFEFCSVVKPPAASPAQGFVPEPAPASAPTRPSLPVHGAAYVVAMSRFDQPVRT